MQKCIESTISGKNLNYSYLVWINRKAQELGLKGITFFKNDGSIKTIAEGEEANLYIFMNKLQRGKFYFPLFSPVDNFSMIIHEPRKEFEDFSISESKE